MRFSGGRDEMYPRRLRKIKELRREGRKRQVHGHCCGKRVQGC